MWPIRTSLNLMSKPLKGFLQQEACNIYSATETFSYPKHARIVDFRSDTLSKPNEDMRRAIYQADVGDDVYGEDPTTNELQKKAAKMLGKEEAIFVPSGTMANLLALMSHCEDRGCEVIVGDESHILLWEQAGAAQHAGIQLRSVPNKKNGTFDITEMIKKVRNNKLHSFLPRTALVCVENTHNNYGGKVLPLAWLRELAKATKELGIPLHMDGARFFNSVVRLGASPRDIVQDFDTINICLSKGLGAPVGSLLVGSKVLIDKAKHFRKAIGGGMRQIGHMAAAGIYALDNMVGRLKEDHDHTYAIAKAIEETGSKIVTVDLESLQTNILLINVDVEKVTPEKFCQRLLTLTDQELKEDIPVVAKVLPWINNTVRLVVCCNNNDEDVKAVIRKFKTVIHEYDSQT